jgi:hypothetical protein
LGHAGHYQHQLTLLAKLTLHPTEVVLHPSSSTRAAAAGFQEGVSFCLILLSISQLLPGLAAQAGQQGKDSSWAILVATPALTAAAAMARKHQHLAQQQQQQQAVMDQAGSPRTSFKAGFQAAAASPALKRKVCWTASSVNRHSGMAAAAAEVAH